MFPFLFLPSSILTSSFFSIEPVMPFQRYLSLGLNRSRLIFVVGEFKFFPIGSDCDNVSDYIGIVVLFSKAARINGAVCLLVILRPVRSSR